MRTATSLVTALLVAQGPSVSLATASAACKSPLSGSYAQAVQTYPYLKDAITMVAGQPIAQWFTDRQDDLPAVAADLFRTKCTSSSSSKSMPSESSGVAQRPTVVVYGLPGKDCEAGFSTSGQNRNQEDYRNFLQLLADSAQTRAVVYILEPDAIGLLAENGCGNYNGYQENLMLALEILGQNPNADIYLDIGYWTVQSDAQAAQVAALVKSVDRERRCKGIALNTSNYRPVAEMVAACDRFARVSGLDYHCIIDTSRNAVHPPASNEWCNTKGAGMGALPTATTGYTRIDYFVWVKPPGESDGECGGQSEDAMAGPSAGAFFEEQFVQLWNNGVFVTQLAEPAITGGAAADEALTPVSGPTPTPMDTGSPVMAPQVSMDLADDDDGDDQSVVDTPPYSTPASAPVVEGPSTPEDVEYAADTTMEGDYKSMDVERLASVEQDNTHGTCE